MDTQRILRSLDHTLLRQSATLREIYKLCDEAERYRVASVCLPPCHVMAAAERLGRALPVCTVIGFPNGYMTTASKCFEAADAVLNGAVELDMVINLGLVKDRRWNDVLGEIREVRNRCEGRILKVIVETSFLDTDEKLALCSIVSESGADFIKTSTGFVGGGATVADIELFASNIGNGLKIKASGGIRSLESAEALLNAGASRIGASGIIALL